MALECTEHTNFDAIFIMNDPKCTLKAFDFLRIIRNIGLSTPVILLHDHDIRLDCNEPGFPVTGFASVNSTANHDASVPAPVKFTSTLK